MRKVRLILMSLLLLLFASCEREGTDVTLSVGPFGAETRKVLLLYEAGFNSLGTDIRRNIETLKEGYLPGKGRHDDVLLVFSHLPVKSRAYTQATAPALVRMYRANDIIVTDTLKVWPEGTVAADAALVNEVFTTVRDLFPAAGYGAVLSSHATGWLPEGYFSNPKPYEGNDRGGGSIDIWSAARKKTFGQEYYTDGKKTKEIELKDLAAAIPYHLDYILFDACLMASVEVAWELRNVCTYLAAAPCEIPAAGFNYKTLTHHLLEPEVPDLKGACEDYFSQYEHDTTYGAAITMLDCRALDPLASVCRDLFSRYRDAIRNVSGKNVQVYDRISGGKNYLAFFDLKDLLREAGASPSDLQDLQDALDAATVYEAHTAQFINISLTRCCGLSVYLPSYPDYRKDTYHGTEFLDGFYKENVSWNEATMLVE